MRRPQNLKKISHLFWQNSCFTQNEWEIFSNFCALWTLKRISVFTFILLATAVAVKARTLEHEKKTWEDKMNLIHSTVQLCCIARRRHVFIIHHLLSELSLKFLLVSLLLFARFEPSIKILFSDERPWTSPSARHLVLSNILFSLGVGCKV